MKYNEQVSIADSVKIGKNFVVWEFTKIREFVEIGDNVNIGRNVYIGPGTIIKNSVKIQNNSLIYEPSIIEEGVFIGPGVILTNDKYPRAINENMTKKNESDWSKLGVVIEKGASIGAGSLIVAPIKIGQWSMVGAGSVVLKNVNDYSLVFGNPAKHIAWVSRSGVKLNKLSETDSNIYICPMTNDKYIEIENNKLEYMGKDK